MEITLLIKSILGLVIVLGLLIFLFVYSSSEKAKKAKKNVSATKKKSSNNPKDELDLMALKNIIKNRDSSSKKLKEALDLILKNYGHITKKLGTRPHPIFDIYQDILFSLCRHKNTTKNHIVNFDKELIRLNPEYKAEINDAVTKGLNSRGA